MRIALMAVILFLMGTSFATAGNGTISVISAHDVQTTADRLEEALNNKGMTIFTRINHAEGAQNVGMELRPTELVIFGNPKIGTPLMLCAQSVAIDLPQKALIWKAKDGQVWYTYNDPGYLADRHNIGECKEVLKRVSGALGKFAKAATMP